jgi:tripartite-type tricarboxylate transporter receptor subunit TctC
VTYFTEEISMRYAIKQRRLSAALVSILAVLLGAPLAQAQNYPVKPVRVVLPFSPGGATDILARIAGQALSEAWGQPVIVDNRPGAGGAIAGSLVTRANPDGYTLYMPSGTIVTANPHIYPKLPYNPEKDLVPITNLASSPQVIVVQPGFAAKTVKDLIAMAKAKPKTLTFSSAGVGSQTHLASESFAFAAGIDLIHVPYKSGGLAATAVLSGEVNLTTANVPVAVGHINQGRMRALAVTSRKRISQLPDVPTVADTIPGFENLGWWALMAPAGTPKPVIEKVQRDVVKMLQSAEVRARLDQLGMDPIGSSPAEFARQLRQESEQWAKIVRERGLQVN